MKKGVNILLIIILLSLIGALGFFSYKLIFQEDKILVPDFSNSTQQEIETWCNSLEKNPCSFEENYSDDVPKGKLIYQSISANEELGDSISFIISLGQKIEIQLPTVDEDTTKETIDAWLKEHNITNQVNYAEEESNDVAAGFVIRIEPSIITESNQIINIYISSGSKEDYKDEIDVEAGDYVGYTVEKFNTAVKKLGLSPNHKESKDEHSSTVEVGDIVWHGSGTYVKNETINYGLSLGPGEGDIIVESGTYVGKTLDEFKEAVAKLGENGLTPVHKEDRDDYSNTVKLGSIVWHGSGSYVDKENISYGLSLGPSDAADIVITKGMYVGKTLEEFLEVTKNLGLKAEHSETYPDSYSDTIKKGSVDWHGSGTYVKGEVIHYTLSLGKKDGSDSEIVIKSGDYVGKTLDEFKKLVEALGLVPAHSEAHEDEYSDTIAKGSIVWHGSGTYVDGETIHYTVSLGKKGGESSTEIVIKSGTYVGKTLDEFKKIVSDLGLTAEHSNTYSNDYSDTIPKGSIDWHGSGTYKKGEVIHYTLSLGKKDKPEPTPVKTVTISDGQYVGLTESKFKSKMDSLNLGANHNSNKDAYSSQAVGTVIWHNSGTFDEGSTISYGLSLGQETKHINNFTIVSTACEVIGSYDSTASKTIEYFNNIGFNNVTCVGAQGGIDDESIGIILSITVNGDNLVAGDYPSDSSIVVTICNAVR